MFKLLFLTHTGTGQPPAALFMGVSRVLCKSIQ